MTKGEQVERVLSETKPYYSTVTFTSREDHATIKSRAALKGLTIGEYIKLCSDLAESQSNNKKGGK